VDADLAQRAQVGRLIQAGLTPFIKKAPMQLTAWGLFLSRRVTGTFGSSKPMGLAA
jgi:hypothetical protein